MTQSAPPQDAASVIAQEFIVDQPCAVAVDVPGARVRLRPGSQDDRVEVTISVSGCPAEEAEQILDRLGVGTQQMKNTVQVSADPPRTDARWWRWVRTLDVTVHVDLRLPPEIEADLRAPGGSIDIQELNGHVDAKVMGGSCQIQDVEGTLDIRAESCDVSLRDLSGEQVVARVAVGSLTVEDITADRLTLRSVSAPVRLRSIQGITVVRARSTDVEIRDLSGPSTIESRGGSLDIEMPLTDAAELTVVGASLDLRLPTDCAADLAMRGASLSIDEALAFEGEAEDQQVDGTLRGGGPSLTIEAIGGSAHVGAA